MTHITVRRAQCFTPPNFAAHSGGVRVFALGRPASPGAVAVAENGMVPALAAELSAAIDGEGLGTSGVGPGIDGGPIPPGAMVSFDVRSTEGRFSLVSMVICSPMAPATTRWNVWLGSSLRP